MNANETVTENQEMRAALKLARETGRSVKFTRDTTHFKADPDGRAWEWAQDFYQRWIPRGEVA